MPDQLNSRVAQFEADVDLAHQLIHGTAEQTVTTEGGELRTFAGAIAEYDSQVAQSQTGQNRAAAEEAATNATSAKTAAETARDAAQLSAGVYADTTTGLAATTNGKYFSVPATSANESLILYKNNAGAAQEVKRYPSATVVASLKNRTDSITATFSRGGYIGAYGAFASDAGWGTTELIPIASIKVVALALYGHTNVRSIAFYDANKAPISGVVAAQTGTPVTSYPVPPAGAVYVTFSYFKADLANQVFNVDVAVWAIPSGAEYKATADQVAALRAQVVQEDLTPLATLPGFINKSGMLGSPDTNWLSSAYIELTAGTVVDCKMTGHPSVNSLSFYDANQSYLSGVGGTVDGAYFTAPVTAPAGTAFLRLCYGHPTNHMATAGKVSRATVDVALKTVIDGQTAATKQRVDLLEASISPADYAALATLTGYITTAGAVNSRDSNFLRSDYLPVTAGEKIDCDLIGHTAISCVAFYDINKAFLSGQSATSNAVPGARFTKSVSVPVGAAFARISFGNPATYSTAAGMTPKAISARNMSKALATVESSVASATEALKSAAPAFSARRKLVLTPNTRILLYGDSISSTDYPWYKEQMEALTGAAVYNGGFSGHTAAQLATDADVQRIFDYDPHLIVVMVGGNDTGAQGTVGSFSGAVTGEPIVAETNPAANYAGTYYIQAVSHLARKIKAHYYNIRARAALTGAESEAEKAAKIDAVTSPVIVFCTPLPQQRNNAGDAFSLATNWRRKRDAVIECCNKYGIHCIDLANKVQFDMALEPYWVGPTNKTANNGVYTMDGLHPNKYGYRTIAQIVCAEIGL